VRVALADEDLEIITTKTLRHKLEEHFGGKGERERERTRGR